MAYEPKNNLHNAYDDNMVCVGVDSDGSYLYVPKNQLEITTTMKDFKIGDRVRVKDTPNPEWMQNMPALPDTIFKVEGTQNDKLILSMECSDARFIVDAEHFELVETPEHPNNMAEFSYEPISKAEAYIVNQVFGDSYIRASNKCFDIKGELKEPDPKTAFLTELQSLLRKYNVSICHAINIVGNGIVHDMIEFDFGDDSILYVKPENHPLEITPDNIFNYDKE